MYTTAAILIRLHAIDVKMAQEMLLHELEACERPYCEAKEKYIAENSPGPNIKRSFGMLDLFITRR